MAEEFIVTIHGVEGLDTINVRTGPGVNNSLVFKAPKGQTGIRVLNVVDDEDHNVYQAKVYQWFHLVFPDGRDAWARDDLIDVQGDGSYFGYGMLPQPVLAFTLTRDKSITFTPLDAPSSGSVQVITSSTPVTDTQPTTDTPTDSGSDSVQVITSSTPVTDAQPPTDTPTDSSSDSVQVITGSTPVTDTQPTTDTPTDSSSDSVQVITGSTSVTDTQPTTDADPGTTLTRNDPIGPARLTIRGQSGLNLRSGRSTFTSIVVRIPKAAELDILEVGSGETIGDPFQWIRVNYNGHDGWVREDFVRLRGRFQKFGLNASDQYPSPVEGGWWVRDFNPNQNNTRFTSYHLGWDFGANVGEPLLAGPKGGVVTKIAFCQPCGSQGLSAPSLGFNLNDPQVLNSEAWNYGYGHYVLVRYDNDLLPEFTKQQLSQRNLAGAHLFVIYAHMHDIEVGQGQTLQPNQRIGTLGNSGNSSGPHLHLEVRANANPTAQFYQSELFNPGVLFLR